MTTRAQMTRAQRTGGFLGRGDEKAPIVELRASDLRQGDDLVYYNANLYNNTGLVIEAKINDLRSQAVIDVPEDWHMSVVRFVVSGELIPLALIPMLPIQITGFDTELLVSIGYLGVNYNAYVQASLIINNRGVFYNFSDLVGAINAAFDVAYALVPGPTSSAAPFLSYNSVTGSLDLYYQATYVTVAPPNQMFLFVNYPLYQYMFSMPAFYDHRNIDPTSPDVQIELVSPDAVTVPLANRDGYPVGVQPALMAGQVYKLQQEAPAVQIWSSISNVFLTTNSIPVQSEYLPTNALTGQNEAFSSNSQPIISDFAAFGDDNPMLFRQAIEYLPTAEYRMIHMAGREPLKRLDVQFWYRTIDGIAYPLLLPPGTSANVKLMFRKKGAW